MAIQFYSWPRSSGTRIHWALEELGIDHEYVQLDRAAGEHRQPAYLAINPNGKVPALVDDGIVLFESLAILLHLGDRYGVERGLWPAPDAGQRRADALAWLSWSLTELHAFMMQYLYHGKDTPVSYKPEQRSQAAAEYNLMSLNRQIGMLEMRLASQQHVLGDFSLVDIPISSSLIFGRRLGVDLGARPTLDAWLERVQQRPALANAR
jgi:glutathione S-transferase